MKALQHSDWRIRSRAIDLLKSVKEPSILQPLLTALKDVDPVVRIKAIEALGEYKEPWIAPAIAEKFGDDDAGVVDVAVLSMRAQGEVAIEYLLPSLKNPMSRNAIARALGEIGNNKAIPALIQAIKDDSTGNIYNLVNALGSIKDKIAVNVLADILLKHTRGIDREAAAKALGEIGDRAAIPALIEMLYAKVDSAPLNLQHSISKLHPFNHEVVIALGKIDKRFETHTREEIQGIFDGMKARGEIPMQATPAVTTSLPPPQPQPMPKADTASTVAAISPQNEAELRKKLKRILSRSSRVRIDMVRDAIQLDPVTFSQKIWDWAENLNFKIDGDYIVFEHQDMDQFLADLDANFDAWEAREQAKEGKLENAPEVEADTTTNVNFKCPKCGKTFNFSESAIEQEFTCEWCNTPLNHFFACPHCAQAMMLPQQEYKQCKDTEIICPACKKSFTV